MTSASTLTLRDRPIIAKTGTTNDFRDGWTIGASPQIAVGVWVGNADNEPMEKVSGSIGASPIFNDIMKYAHESLPVAEWEEPEGMVRKVVCTDSGKLPTDLVQPPFHRAFYRRHRTHRV